MVQRSPTNLRPLTELPSLDIGNAEWPHRYSSNAPESRGKGITHRVWQFVAIEYMECIKSNIRHLLLPPPIRRFRPDEEDGVEKVRIF